MYIHVIQSKHQFYTSVKYLARYSHLLSEVKQHGMNEFPQTSKRLREDSKPGFIDEALTFNRKRYFVGFIYQGI